jgi:hypothetical protein
MPTHSLRATIVANRTGECHHSPPARDFAWPRTLATDHCSRWEAQPSVPARAATPRQAEIFEAGAPEPAPVLAVVGDAAAGSTPDGTGPASIQFATGTKPAGAKPKGKR